MRKEISISIDGPAGSGKSSVAREVARRLGISHLDTGATYRAVALGAVRGGIDPADATALSEVARDVSLTPEGIELGGGLVEDAELRTPEVSVAASQVSQHPLVRQILVERQRAAGHAAGAVVMEGRDIGTVVLPDADLKVYLSASPEERALRRAKQSGRTAEVERIRAAIGDRDRQDSEREASPLRSAEDAVEIDTTGLTLEEVVDQVVALAERAS